jgi:hypothetical protein
VEHAANATDTKNKVVVANIILNVIFTSINYKE